MNKLNGSVLEGHALVVMPSEKRISVTPTTISQFKLNKNSSSNINSIGTMKLIVRNLAFQATKKELSSLFSVFGFVKRVRIPKKMGRTHICIFVIERFITSASVFIIFIIFSDLVYVIYLLNYLSIYFRFYDFLIRIYIKYRSLAMDFLILFSYCYFHF